jgi:mRNA interferase MazF
LNPSLKLEYVPERGDIVWLDFDPQLGHEQAKRRPAIVLSADRYNRLTGLAIFCPITSKIKGFPWEVPVPIGLAIGGVILSDQVKNLDWRARKAEFIDKIPSTTLEIVINTFLRLFEEI